MTKDGPRTMPLAGWASGRNKGVAAIIKANKRDEALERNKKTKPERRKASWSAPVGRVK
jgi:hypothetical protein